MANLFAASIYRIGANDLNSGTTTNSTGQVTKIPAAQGIINAFPSQGVRCYPAPASTTANGVTINSIIALLPTGLNQPEKLFYTPTTVADLITAANA